jgi:adenine-specific DNA-methyltransferase
VTRTSSFNTYLQPSDGEEESRPRDIGERSQSSLTGALGRAYTRHPRDAEQRNRRPSTAPELMGRLPPPSRAVSFNGRPVPACQVAPSPSMLRERTALKAQRPRRLVLERRFSRGVRGTGNLLALGDNLAVLEALGPTLLGTVRCIYIDPPYNNQERYSHYDDVLTHDSWLEAIAPRLRSLWSLLRPDGSLWISIDDREAHYLKVLLDSLCGRSSFLTTVIWEQRTTRENRRAFSANHEYILVYAKDPSLFRATRHRLPPTDVQRLRYRNPDQDPRGPWQSVSLNVQAGHGTPSQFYELTTPSGRRLSPPEGRCWMFTAARLADEVRRNNIWFGRDGNGVPRLKQFLAGGRGLAPHTLWRAEEVGTTDSAKKHLIGLFPRRDPFDTPKPEGLVARIVQIASDPEDLVLDAYLGSGTTAAVAHKLGRRYIGIDDSQEAMAVALARLAAVVTGERGGISAQVGWRGGSGFEFKRLR